MGFTDNAINFNRVQYDAVKSDVKINFFITTPAFRQQKNPLMLAHERIDRR